MVGAGGGTFSKGLKCNGLRQYRPSGGPEGRGGRSGAAADGGSSSEPGVGQPAGFWGWHDPARSDGRTTGRLVEAGATAEITEPACTTSPAGWEGESGTGESSASGAAGSEGSSGSSAQGGLTAMGHVSCPGLRRPWGGCGRGRGGTPADFSGPRIGQGSQTSRRTGGRCSILPTVSLPWRGEMCSDAGNECGD